MTVSEKAGGLASRVATNMGGPWYQRDAASKGLPFTDPSRRRSWGGCGLPRDRLAHGPASARPETRSERRARSRRPGPLGASGPEQHQAMKRPAVLSPEFADVLGQPVLSRSGAASALWSHCKEQGMATRETKPRRNGAPA